MMPDIRQDQLPEQVASFEPVEAQVLKAPVADYEEEVGQHDLHILDLEEADLHWKLLARKIFSVIFTSMLVLQNAGVAWLLYAAYVDGKLESLAVISSGLVVGTLAETAFIVRIMVQWIFSDSHYEVRKK